MTVPSNITDLSATAASNSPAGSESIGTSLDDYLRAGFSFTRQMFDTGIIWGGTATGTNTITFTASPAPTAYKTGQGFAFISAGANTGATTINANSISAKNLYKNGSTALVGGEIPGAGALVVAVYDGTQFQLQNVQVANPFSDSSALVKGSSDATKLMRFEVDGLTTATTRTLTPQDKNYTIADNADVLLRATIASPTFTGTPTAPTAAVNTSTTQLATTAFANPASSLSANGYVELPSGLIVQWGVSGTFGQSNTTANITFPVAFATSCYVVVPVGLGPVGYTTTDTHCSAISTSGFTVYSGCTGFNWIAVGI